MIARVIFKLVLKKERLVVLNLLIIDVVAAVLLRDW